MKAAEKMTKAKAALILEQPFFASILCSLPMTEDNDIPTMATNGKWVRYNAEFVEKMSLDEVRFVLCHEVGHCIFQHMFRRGDRNPKRWNYAGDYIINDLLIRENIGKMPEGGLHNPQLVQAGGGTSEGVYELLPDMPDDGSGYGGTAIDECVDSGGSEAERAADEAKMKVQVAQAAQAAKMMGKLSAGMQRFVDSALRPKLDWRDVLRRFVSSKAKVEFSYARPKRRFATEDFILPSLSGEMLGEIVVAVDCSGSIGERELSEFAAEIRAITEDTKPVKLHVVYFDSEVCHHDEFDPDDELHIEPHGGGGTAFSPIFAHVEDKGIDPTCCVVLTDLYCNDYGDAPHYPVLWITTGAKDAPWGEVIEMKPKL